MTLNKHMMLSKRRGIKLPRVNDEVSSLTHCKYLMLHGPHHLMQCHKPKNKVEVNELLGLDLFVSKTMLKIDLSSLLWLVELMDQIWVKGTGIKESYIITWPSLHYDSYSNLKQYISMANYVCERRVEELKIRRIKICCF